MGCVVINAVVLIRSTCAIPFSFIAASGMNGLCSKLAADFSRRLYLNINLCSAINDYLHLSKRNTVHALGFSDMPA